MLKAKDTERVIFTKEMKKTHTILIPGMLNIHLRLIKNALDGCGYKTELLTNEGPYIAQMGLKYVHNDTCYPALLVIGQMIDALKSGKYDMDHVALIITQTGGGCRASNYIHLLRKALKRAGMGHVPVISLNMSGMEPNPGFTLNIKMIRRLIAGFVYGDLLMLLANQARPYEVKKGEVDALLSRWVDDIGVMFARGKGYGIRRMKPIMRQMAESFDAVPHVERDIIKVGIVGEIYMKYASLGNSNLEGLLQEQDVEYMIPGVIGFGLFSMDNRLEDYRLYGGGKLKYRMVSIMTAYVNKLEDALIESVEGTRFMAPGKFSHTRTLVDGVISHGSKMGEGWLLTAEMLELIEYGYPNIVCAQPFGCLPNHINGRGMMNSVRQRAPEANIVAIDYDPSASRVNQENRIKLMLASAKRPSEYGQAYAQASESVDTAVPVPQLHSDRQVGG